MLTTEEEAILGETAAFSDAWNRGDARAAASFYTEDALRVGAYGDIQIGKKEIEAAYDRLFHQFLAGALVSQDEGTVRMLTPDFAVWEAGMEIDPGGGKPILKGYVMQVMKKVNGRWLVLEAHPKFFPPQM